MPLHLGNHPIVAVGLYLLIFVKINDWSSSTCRQSSAQDLNQSHSACQYKRTCVPANRWGLALNPTTWHDWCGSLTWIFFPNPFLLPHLLMFFQTSGLLCPLGLDSCPKPMICTDGETEFRRERVKRTVLPISILPIILLPHFHYPLPCLTACLSSVIGLGLALTQRNFPGVRTVLTVIISITAVRNSCYPKPKEGPVALHLSPVQTGVCHSPMHIMIGTLFQFHGSQPYPVWVSSCARETDYFPYLCWPTVKPLHDPKPRTH